MLHSQIKINADVISHVEILRYTRGPDGGLPREGQLCTYRWDVAVGKRGERDRLHAAGVLEHPYSHEQGGFLGLYLLVLRKAAEQLGLPVG